MSTSTSTTSRKLPLTFRQPKAPKAKQDPRKEAASQETEAPCPRPGCHGKIVDRLISNATLRDAGMKAMPTQCDSEACLHKQTALFYDKNDHQYFFDPTRQCKNCGQDLVNSQYRNKQREADDLKPVPCLSCVGAQNDHECKKSTQWGKLSVVAKIPKPTREELQKELQQKDQFIGALSTGLAKIAEHLPYAVNVTSTELQKDTHKTVTQFTGYQDTLHTRMQAGVTATTMDLQTTLLLGSKAAVAISECALTMIMNTMQANDTIVDSTKAADVLKQHFDDIKQLCEGFDNVDDHDNEDQDEDDDEDNEEDDDDDDRNVEDDDGAAQTGGGNRRSGKYKHIIDSDDDDDDDIVVASVTGTPVKKPRSVQQAEE